MTCEKSQEIDLTEHFTEEYLDTSPEIQVIGWLHCYILFKTCYKTQEIVMLNFVLNALLSFTLLVTTSSTPTRYNIFVYLFKHLLPQLAYFLCFMSVFMLLTLVLYDSAQELSGLEAAKTHLECFNFFTCVTLADYPPQNLPFQHKNDAKNHLRLLIIKCTQHLKPI